MKRLDKPNDKNREISRIESILDKIENRENKKRYKNLVFVGSMIFLLMISVIGILYLVLPYSALKYPTDLTENSAVSDDNNLTNVQNSNSNPEKPIDNQATDSLDTRVTEIENIVVTADREKKVLRGAQNSTPPSTFDLSSGAKKNSLGKIDSTKTQQKFSQQYLERQILQNPDSTYTSSEQGRARGAGTPDESPRDILSDIRRLDKDSISLMRSSRPADADSIKIGTQMIAPQAVEKKILPVKTTEIPPIFPGGEQAMFFYIYEEMNYPNKAIRHEIEGIVFVQMVINPNGSISNVKVVKGLGFGCDEEAKRIVKNMPSWSPGKNQGRVVPVQKIIPIRFTF